MCGKPDRRVQVGNPKETILQNLIQARTNQNFGIRRHTDSGTIKENSSSVGKGVLLDQGAERAEVEDEEESGPAS